MPLFEGLEVPFLSSLAARMRIVTFTPKEIIFRCALRHTPCTRAWPHAPAASSRSKPCLRCQVLG